MRLRGVTVVLLIVPILVFGLELEKGRIKLEIQEGVSRFTVRYLPDKEASEYVSLLLDDDPRTTTLSVIDGNRVYRIGDASSFSEDVEETQEGVRITSTGKTIRVIQDFAFVASAGSVLADGLRIDIWVFNVGLTDRAVGLRYVFDTYLGETGGIHFATAEREEIERELTLVKGQTEGYWISSDGTDGVQVMTEGGGVTVPDRVVFANWKRLNDAAWDYETASSRNFNLLPYSINDSAVAHYYEPRALSPGESYKVTVLIGAANPAGFTSRTVSQVSQVTEILEKAATDRVGNRRLAIQTDIQTLDDLIEQINQQLSSGEISRSDIPLIEQVIAELKKKYQ